VQDKPDKTTVCAAALTALSIDASGAVAPCCEYDGKVGSLRDNSLREIWMDKPLATLRKKLDKGVRVKRCWKCWQAENAGSGSLRERLNRRHAEFLRARPKDVDPEYLDFRFSNLCTFRCRTCYHGASSRWFKDAKAMNSLAGPKALLSAFPSAADGLAQFEDIGGNVTNLYFAGGEPLLEQQHYDLLKTLIADGRTGINLAYNTSLATLDFEGSDLVEMWKNFPDLHIETSIDAIGDAGALIRKGFDWVVFRNNLQRLMTEIPHMALQIGVTVSVLNILRIVELHKALVSECGVDPDAFNIHAVQYPLHYDICILPKDLHENASIQIKAYARQLLAGNPDSKSGKQFLLLLERIDNNGAAMTPEKIVENQQKFRKITTQLDGLRDEKTLDVLPELRSLIQS